MISSTPSSREKKLLVLLIAITVALLAGLFFWRSSQRGGEYEAVIESDGQTVAVLELKDYQNPVRISLAELGVDKPVYFELYKSQIRFVDVDCPDKLCEGFGFIGLPTQTAVCAPNRVAVMIRKKGAGS